MELLEAHGHIRRVQRHTIAVAKAIKDDTGNILGQARLADRYAHCIDQRVPGAGGTGGACQ